MRILIFNYEYPPLGGGAGNACYYKLQEFKKMPDMEVHLITTSTSRFRIAHEQNVHIHYLDIDKNEQLHEQGMGDLLRYSWQSYGYAQQLHKVEPFDLVHAFFGIPSGFYAQFFGVPYLVSLMGSDVPFHTKKYYWPDKLLFAWLNRRHIWPNSYALIANSEGLKEEVLAISPQQPVAIIENGVDTEFFCPSETYSPLLEIITVSRITQHKGYQHLFEALADCQNYNLTMVGDGPDVEHFKALGQQLDIRVTFTGKLDKTEVRDHLQRAQIFVLPSLNEGMSNAAMEAMACGLALIMTNVGGAQELVQDNGFIIEKGATLPLTEVLKPYFSSPDLVQQHGEASRTIALRKSWTAAAQAYHDLYTKAIDAKK